MAMQKMAQSASDWLERPVNAASEQTYSSETTAKSGSTGEKTGRSAASKKACSRLEVAAATLELSSHSNSLSRIVATRAALSPSP